MLEVEANLGSVGYHGNHKIPDEIPEKLIKFNMYKNGKILSLLSNESTFIHNAFIVEALEIRVPSGIGVKITPIEYEKLEGR